ncbi:hypothetical protein [Streptomyces sp. EKS3.2]|uniref:hypothetical protein n=1 Tax=Streptomyces sp. EKS3.2 TaxID=3461008 RepID=UPI0040414ACB
MPPERPASFGDLRPDGLVGHRTDEGVGMRAQHCVDLLRKAEEPPNRFIDQWPDQGGNEIGCALRGQSADQFRAQSPGVLTEGRQGAARGRTQRGGAQPGVLGTVLVDQTQAHR